MPGGKSSYGRAARRRTCSYAADLASASERGPNRENAAEVSRRRSLKTKGPAAFATGPAIVGDRLCYSRSVSPEGMRNGEIGLRAAQKPIRVMDMAVSGSQRPAPPGIRVIMLPGVLWPGAIWCLSRRLLVRGVGSCLRAP